jgi:hypothetical protein
VPRFWLCKRHRDGKPVITESPPNWLTRHLGDRGAEHMRKGAAPPEPPATSLPHVGTSEPVCSS